MIKNFMTGIFPNVEIITDYKISNPHIIYDSLCKFIFLCVYGYEDFFHPLNIVVDTLNVLYIFALHTFPTNA